MTINRRNFLFLLGATTGTAALGLYPKTSFAQSQGSEEKPFKAIPLPYAYDALEPYIDAETMRFHHDKHYATYTKNFNAAISKYPQLANQSAEEIISDLDRLPQDIRTTVRNNGGGYVNHTMFWEIMSPKGGDRPTGELARAIDKTFGSFDKFKTAFNDTGSKQFGSGWAWLVLDRNKQLKIMGTPNQDSPLMMGMYPVMGNDVWEHAYYLKYRNERGKYLDAWWNVVNWDEVNKRYQQAMAS
ncbi:superoxide dismutase [Hydrococcus rivularis NIES-593]|uniref:Superoxide dismutase n=1 Tax=Hydrococcus rivularis NIES-593 TaxID=1921803 RepID=A0A1U7HG70_9CYAN|nr:superoxide dismutase [Hydrococcus rivularis]OKH22577.1 superoxide dismutase [Hydrococcus rivularis NIES-593]